MLLPNERFPNVFGNAIKRIFDITISISIIISILPLIIPLILYIKINKSSFIFKHYRIGKNGKIFPCYKIQTMKNNADEILIKHLASNESARKEWSLEYKLKEDPRVTPFGRILRKLSIDELPQLINVVKGDMSLVGPRPITSSEIKYYGNYFNDYKKVRPGITGLWQISGRNDIGYEQRVLLDAWYVSNQSLKLDIFILIKTILVLITLKGAY
jgi:undecaprenyl-phosphate galactose phosphotransferase